MNYLSSLVVTCILAADPQPGYMLEMKPAQKIEAELKASEHFTNFRAKEWIIFAGDAPRLPSQPDAASYLEPDGKAVKELSDRGRLVMMARIPGTQPGYASGYDITLKVQATLMSRHLVPVKPGDKVRSVPGLTAPEEAKDLEATTHVNFKSPEFQKWLDRHNVRRGKTASDLDFAREAFLAVRNNFTYFYDVNQDRTASKLCSAKTTDCGGMSLMFVAICRANDVPARLLIGRWAASSKPPDKPSAAADAQTHVKAEFFAKGIGWVPVDLSSSVSFDKSKEGLRFFGHDPGDFVTLHVDGDMLVNTIHFNKQPVDCLQGVAVWATGDGKMENGKFKETWTVRKLP